MTDSDKETEDNSRQFLNAALIFFEKVSDHLDDRLIVASQFARFESAFKGSIGAGCTYIFDEIKYTLGFNEIGDFEYIDVIPGLTKKEKLALIQDNVIAAFQDIYGRGLKHIYRKELKYLHVDGKKLEIEKIFDAGFRGKVFKEKGADNYYLDQLVWHDGADISEAHKITYEQYMDFKSGDSE